MDKSDLDLSPQVLTPGIDEYYLEPPSPPGKKSENIEFDSIEELHSMNDLKILIPPDRPNSFYGIFEPGFEKQVDNWFLHINNKKRIELINKLANYIAYAPYSDDTISEGIEQDINSTNAIDGGDSGDSMEITSGLPSPELADFNLDYN